MNKRIIHTVTKAFRICMMAVAVMLASCATDELGSPDGSTTMQQQMFNFGFKNFNDVKVTTRSTLPPIAEARVMNFYLMVFDSSGNLAYDHYFDSYNLVDNALELAKLKDAWMVNNLDPALGAYTNGTVRMNCPDVTNGHLYMITNLDDYLFNINKDLLATVQTEDQLKSLVCVYQQATLERGGLFIMVGQTSVTVNENILTINPSGSDAGTWGNISGVGDCLKLIRNDSKVTVNIGVVPGAVSHRQVYNAFLGTNVDVYQVIDDFEPTSWQVVNIPYTAWLVGRTGSDKHTDLISGANDIKATSVVHAFESQQEESCNGFDPTDKTNPIPITDNSLRRNVYGFSFYTLENHQTAKKSTVDAAAEAKYGAGNIGFNLRDKRNKEVDGTYSSGDMWEYAPEKATYLIIKGVVKMQYDDNVMEQQTLNANVTYYIHLGDLTQVASRPESGPDNFCIERNTHYTYNINIKGVNNIQVEVTLDNNGWNEQNETQSGATGRVYVAQEAIYTFDAHYGQRVYRFNAEKMLHIGEVENLTWAVFTPFGRNGSPERVGVNKVEVPNGLDYQWAHFMLNSKEASYIEPHAGIDGGSKEIVNEQYPNYCQMNRWWPGDASEDPMNVMQFCDLLRKELTKYRTIRQQFLTAHPEVTSAMLPTNAEFQALVTAGTAFDSEQNIFATVFIDEFYYERDPISSAVRSSLWHEFVNQPNRALHIMCDTRDSRDGESQEVGTAVTIYQRAIQTIYGNKATEGWGVETDDELGDNAKFHTRLEQQRDNSGGSWLNRTQYNLNSLTNRSNDNGRYNSACLIGMVHDNAETHATLPWSDYLDFTRTNTEVDAENGYGFMVADDEKATMRYAWLARNRDNNGNGLIDPDEVRWYLASINQLKELYIGDRGISSTSRLYNIQEPDNAMTNPTYGYWRWRSHVVSSTAVRDNGGYYQPQYIWAEEGGSVSPYSWEWNKPGKLSSRCVRNLDSYGTVRAIADQSSFPESVIEMTDNGNGTYTFDLSRLNDQSKNINVQGELLPMDEMSAQSRPVEKFMTGPLGFLDSNGNPRTYKAENTYTTLQNELLLGTQISPEGYRVPSLREMLVIHNKLSGVASFWIVGGTTAHYGVANYYSFGPVASGGKGFETKGQSWGFTPNNITIEPIKDVYIRCVKNVE